MLHWAMLRRTFFYYDFSSIDTYRIHIIKKVGTQKLLILLTFQLLTWNRWAEKDFLNYVLAWSLSRATIVIFKIFSAIDYSIKYSRRNSKSRYWNDFSISKYVILI